MATIYYYKTASDTWLFSSCVKLDAYRGADYLRSLREAGLTVVKLYLNVPEHFDIIRSVFFNADYWDGRTWQDEYEERPLAYE